MDEVIKIRIDEDGQLFVTTIIYSGNQIVFGDFEVVDPAESPIFGEDEVSMEEVLGY